MLPSATGRYGAEWKSSYFDLFTCSCVDGVRKRASNTATAHPRTPWGDPDLEGYYTNKYEYGTPFERPAAFAGRRLDELSVQELADLTKKRQQEAIDRAPFFGGDPEGRIGNSAEFRDIYEVTKGSRPWLVIDPPDGKIPAVLPAARGHWEGDTLVVETTNFKQRSASRNANADTLRLVERFRRTAADRIEWSVTVDDPSTWTTPWTFSMPLTRNEDEAVELYECHEGNHAIFNILSAARAAERQNRSSESR